MRAASVLLALALLGTSCSASAPGAPSAASPDAVSPGPFDDPISPTPSVPAAPAPGSNSTGEPFQPLRTRFAGRILVPLPHALERKMRGATWRPGCPVALADLALLRFNYLGFDGSVKRGPMVVNVAVADDVLGVFRTLFRAGFPIRHVALAKQFHPNADPDSRSSVTASFNCRPIVTPDGPGDTFSQHAWGLAVDVNSLQNPYVAEDGFTRNRFARPYRDRSEDLPGMIHAGDVVVEAFAAIGWTWGGDWSGGKDYMHFSTSGR